MPSTLPSLVRFANFEVDLRAGELRREGCRVRLQEQPFLLLIVLLESAGEVVTREELRKRLWSEDTLCRFRPSSVLADRGRQLGVPGWQSFGDAEHHLVVFESRILSSTLPTLIRGIEQWR